MILLDTSFLIELLTQREDAVLKAYDIDAEPKVISSITLYGLFIGAQHLKRVSDIEEMCETLIIIAPDKEIVREQLFCSFL